MDQVDDNEVAGAPTGSGAKKPKSKVGSRIDNDKLTLLVALAYEKGGKPDWGEIASEINSASKDAARTAWYEIRKKHMKSTGQKKDKGPVNDVLKAKAPKITKKKAKGKNQIVVKDEEELTSLSE